MCHTSLSVVKLLPELTGMKNVIILLLQGKPAPVVPSPG